VGVAKPGELHVLVVWTWRRYDYFMFDNYRGQDLRGQDLTHMDFRNAYLGGVDLRGTNLEGVNFDGAVLWLASLRGANLRGASFIGARLVDADFEQADLTGANFSEAELTFASLRDANLTDVNLQASRLSIPQGAFFIDQIHEDSVFWAADLHGAILSGADFSGAQGVNLTGAIIDDTTKGLDPAWPREYDADHLGRYETVHARRRDEIAAVDWFVSPTLLEFYASA
jgi:hypothetical protein